MNQPPEANRRRAVFVAFAAFWKSGLAEPPVSQARGLQAPAALQQSALRRDRRHSCATPSTLDVRHAETSLQAMQRHLAQALATVGGSVLQGRQVLLDGLRDSLSWHVHVEFRRARLPRLGASFALLLLSRNTTRAFLTSLLSPLRHQVAFSSAVLSLIIYASAALGPLAKSASLPRSFLLFALSASATAKQALGQHPPASTQPLILSRLWSLLAISSL